MDSPKSLGEELGEVTQVTRDSFRLSGTKQIANNDGLTFVSKNGESIGLKVNKTENGFIYPDRMNRVFVGAKIYRNSDHTFQMTLEKKSAERKIPVSILLVETPDGFSVRAALVAASEGASTRDAPTVFSLLISKIPANDPEKSRENILRQLAKSGDTPFLVTSIDTGGNEKYFFTVQQLNELRRGLLDLLLCDRQRLPSIRTTQEQSVLIKSTDNNIPYPADDFHFENNISNRLALQFYRRHGLENPEMAVEKRIVTGRLQVMTTKHCLKYELGYCPKFGGTNPSGLSEPFVLDDGANHFELEFDYRNCMMQVFKM
jgi:putative protease